MANAADSVVPDPGFQPATLARLERAAALCARQGARLTDLRRTVLGFVLESPKPAGAYELLETLRRHHPGAAPPTVYRALEFLVAQGLAHKLERLAAFVPCLHVIDHPEHGGHDHAAQFLICNQCGHVTELNEGDIGEALKRAASRSGFHVSGSTVEAEGACAACSGET